jgi:hypothetical protein
VARIAEQLRDFGGVPSAARIAEVLTTVDHPPLRYLLSLPGWLLAPGTEWGLRLGAVVFSLAAVALAIRIGIDLGGPLVGYSAGLFLAASPVFAWTSAAFGWSVIVVALLAAARLLYGASLDLAAPDERRRLHRVNAWLALAFLANTGAILFFGGTLVAYLNRNLRQPLAVLRSFAPALAFYGAYVLTLGQLAPRALSEYYNAPVKSGQSAHGRSRLESVSPGLDSFLANLQVLNAYLLPFVSWALVILGVAFLARRAPRILLVVAPFALVWSFLLVGATEQYLLLVAIVLVPFGIAAAASLFPHAATRTLFALTIAAMLAWTVVLFLVPYRELEYPSVFEHVYARSDRPPNLVEPYDEIRRDVDRLLQPGERYLARDAGSLPEFYLKTDLTAVLDSRFAGFLGAADYPIELDVGRGCYRLAFVPPRDVRLAIGKLPLCGEDAIAAARYDGSRLAVYTLRHQ